MTYVFPTVCVLFTASRGLTVSNSVVHEWNLLNYPEVGVPVWAYTVYNAIPRRRSIGALGVRTPAIIGPHLMRKQYVMYFRFRG